MVDFCQKSIKEIPKPNKMRRIALEDRKSATELGMLYMCEGLTTIFLYNLTPEKSYEMTFNQISNNSCADSNKYCCGYIHEHTPSLTKGISNCEIVPWTCSSEVFSEIKKLNIKVIEELMMELIRMF